MALVAVTTSSFVNGRGQRLHTAHYKPKGRVATVVLHHGLSEHSGRYDKVCRLLAENGLAVHTFDVHGHGKSEPTGPDDRSYIHSYTHLVDDLMSFVEFVNQEEQKEKVAGCGSAAPPSAPAQPASPLFLMGHSTGALVCSLSMLRTPPPPARGLVLHSALMGVEWTLLLRIQAAMGGLLASLVPRKPLVPAVRPEDMSQDPRVVQEYVEDPLNYVGPVRARTAHQCLAACGEVNRRAPEITVPVYACHGQLDRCTSVSASRKFVEGPGGVSSRDKTYRLVAGGYHELLHGPEWRECTMEVVRWIKERCAAGAEAGMGQGRAAAGAGVQAKM